MKKNLSTIILVAIFFIGLSVLLYPTISDYWNSRTQSKAVVDYDSLVSSMDKIDCDAYFQRAEEYNARLNELDYPLMNYEQAAGYEETLDISGTGIMGYITIEKIGVQLPIYHGTADSVLNIAAGHLEGTSLPIGGVSTHSVISAHRGLPSAKLFTNLDKLELGDTFTITVLDRVLTYEVDQILIVEPNEVEPLYVTEGEDYCTLMTCTPYGINTHRLFVRGVRTDNADGPVIKVAAEAFQIDTLIVTPAVAAPMLLILLIVLLVKYRKKKKN